MSNRQKTDKRQEINKEILMILESYLEKYPDMRFGQALLNLNVVDLDSDEFYTESEVTLQNMLVQIAKLGKDLESPKKAPEPTEVGVKNAKNGYILSYKDCFNGSMEEQEVYSEGDYVGLLYGVLEAVGYFGSRYDSDRVYVIRAPGDKNDAFSEAHSKVIFGESDFSEENDLD